MLCLIHCFEHLFHYHPFCFTGLSKAQLHVSKDIEVKFVEEFVVNCSNSNINYYKNISFIFVRFIFYKIKMKLLTNKNECGKTRLGLWFT